jgi:hypothetical protein
LHAKIIVSNSYFFLSLLIYSLLTSSKTKKLFYVKPKRFENIEKELIFTWLEKENFKLHVHSFMCTFHFLLSSNLTLLFSIYLKGFRGLCCGAVMGAILGLFRGCYGGQNRGLLVARAEDGN